MTESNVLLMEKNVQESLAGRVSYFKLNTLTVHEILSALPKTTLGNIIYQWGWPELYITQDLSTVQYLNDYIRSYIETDIVLSAGIQKQTQLNVVLGLLAARTGMLLDYNNVANDSSVASTAIKDWVLLLQRTELISCLAPYSTNLNKRLTKAPKLYFLDTGLKVSSAKARNVNLPKSFVKTFPEVKHLYVVIFSGKRLQAYEQCTMIPIAELHDFLCEQEKVIAGSSL